MFISLEPGFSLFSLLSKSNLYQYLKQLSRFTGYLGYFIQLCEQNIRVATKFVLI